MTDATARVHRGLRQRCGMAGARAQSVVDDLLKNITGPKGNVTGTTTASQSIAGTWLEKES
jgi:hypothetical protein